MSILKNSKDLELYFEFKKPKKMKKTPKFKKKKNPETFAFVTFLETT